MIAIILAAGSGRRLKTNKPKGMLNIYGKPLIQYSIDALQSAGIKQIIVATGYGASYFHSYFSQIKSSVEFIHNPEFHNSGSLFTLYLVLKTLNKDEDLLILDSDIIYNIDEFIEYIKMPYKNAVMVTNVPDGRYDACYVDEDIYSNLSKISKNMNQVKNQVDDLWEHIGITKVSYKLIPELINYCEVKFKTSSGMKHEYDYAFENLNEKFKVVKYKDYIWSEADDNEQLNFMLTNVYPKLNLYYINEA